jgi:hypothetical protein
MEDAMYRGQLIEVTEAFAGQQVKAVVSWDNERVFVCRKEEFDRANRENREPENIGFKREFVKELTSED